VSRLEFFELLLDPAGRLFGVGRADQHVMPEILGFLDDLEDRLAVVVPFDLQRVGDQTPAVSRPLAMLKAIVDRLRFPSSRPVRSRATALQGRWFRLWPRFYSLLIAAVAVVDDFCLPVASQYNAIHEVLILISAVKMGLVAIVALKLYNEVSVHPAPQFSRIDS
jgi:hypothetical protein